MHVASRTFLIALRTPSCTSPVPPCTTRGSNRDNLAGLRILFALSWFGVATILVADEPGVKSTPECRLMINWDQIDMCGLQLTRAHRHQKPTAASVKAMIEQIVDEHARAKIDRIVHCVFALPRGTVPGGFESFYRDQIAERLFEDTPVGFETLEHGGYDRIQVTLDRARHNGMEFLGGLRMNDRHNHTSPFHASHPEWQLPEFAGGMDYKHAGVRDVVLKFIDEFLARYDVDGLELDWLRWCHVFRPSEARQNAPLLTDFIGAVRERLDATATRRGRRRLLLGVRVPQSLQECESLGYDVGAWIRSGDIDFVCPSDFFYTDFNMKTEAFVKLTEGTRVRVYPSLHPLISWGNDHQNQTRESYRAAAKNYLAFGAHGISAYNYQYHWRADRGREEDWPGVLDFLTGVRDLSAIEAGDRHYLFHPMWSGHGGGIGPSGMQRDVRIRLARGSGISTGNLDLRLAEDPGNRHTRVSLRFKVVGLTKGDSLRVKFNDVPLSDQSVERAFHSKGQSAREGRVLPAFELFQCRLSASDLKIGDNRLSVAVDTTASEMGTTSDELIVQEIEILVHSSPQTSP